jgi:hypothetical protein
MRSDMMGVREIPPRPPPRKTTFVYVAFLCGLSMLLASGALYTHVYLTRRWLTQMKTDAGARLGVASEVSRVDESNRCPIATPVLIGFGEHGEVRCRALPKRCAGGQYIASMDPATLEIQCVEAGAPAANSLRSFNGSARGESLFRVT